MCPPMTAHWRHLANAIELVHPSTHSSPQTKLQIDRISHFCTAHGRKCLYFTTGAPIHQNCPFRWGIWTPSNRWCHGSMRASPQPKQHLDRFRRVCANDRRVPIQWFARFPFKIVPTHRGSGPHVIHGSLGPPESWTQTATRSLQPFLQGSLVWQTDSYRKTDRPRYSATLRETK